MLIVVPARGGSKGLPGKNLLTVGGVSLVGRAVRVGLDLVRRSGTDGFVLVDTDSEAIAEEGRRWGAEVPFLRPPELATDVVPMAANVLRAVERWDAAHEPADRVVLLQPTSPLRTVDDALACHCAYGDVGPSVVAVVPCDHPPEQTLRRRDDGRVAWAWPELGPSGRRQDFAKGFRPAGSVYIISTALLREHQTFVVPEVTIGVAVPPERAVDVDTAADLEFARALFAQRARARLPWGVTGLVTATIHAGVVLLDDGTELPLAERDASAGRALLDDGSDLPCILDAIACGGPSLIVTSSLVRATLLDQAADVPVCFRSDDACELAYAIARGIRVVVAPTQLAARLSSLLVSPGPASV